MIAPGWYAVSSSPFTWMACSYVSSPISSEACFTPLLRILPRPFPSIIWWISVSMTSAFPQDKSRSPTSSRGNLFCSNRSIAKAITPDADVISSPYFPHKLSSLIICIESLSPHLGPRLIKGSNSGRVNTSLLSGLSFSSALHWTGHLKQPLFLTTLWMSSFPSIRSSPVTPIFL